MSYVINDSIIIDANGRITINDPTAEMSLDLSSRKDALILPGGTTLQRLNYGNMLRFNSQLGVIEYNFNNDWLAVCQVPYIDSVSTQVLESINDTVTITGRNFSSNALWTFISKKNVIYNPKTTTYNSSTSVTLTRPDVFPASDGPYILKVKQFNRYNTYEHITAGVIPTFTQAGGSLGTYNETDTSSNIVININDEAGGGISSVVITSGSLPPGLTGTFSQVGVNGTYTITGAFGTIGSTSTYSFRLTATDSGGNTNYMDYSITVTKIVTTYDINQSVGIYSLRKVNSSYAGPLIRLRRVSDNSENDFYITSDNSLNTLSNGTGSYIDTWLGGNMGYVRTWYDQSGQGNHMIETTTSYQPVYMPITRSVMFNSSRLRAYFSNTLTLSTFTMVGYVNFNYGNAAGYFGVESYDGNTFDTLVKNESTYQVLHGSNNFLRTYGNTTIPVNSKHSAVMMFTTSNQRIWIDNNKDYASNTTFSPVSYVGTGSSANGPHFSLGYRHANGATGPLINSEIYEVAYFNSYLSDARVREINENLLSTYSQPYLFNTMTTTTKNSVIVGYSLRRINPNYAGPVVRIRRSTDNSENDFYSTYYGLLNTDPSGNGTTLLSWLGAGTGYASTLYDQSGTNRHARQTTYEIQPQINYATLGYPSLYFNSSATNNPKFMTIGFDRHVVLLLHCEGANNGTTFTDSGYNSITVTNAGGAVTSTAQKKFGSSSFYTNGATGNNYIYVNNSNLAFGTDNFTIEFWINPSNVTTQQRFMGNLSNGVGYSSGNWAFGFNSGSPDKLLVGIYNVGTLTCTSSMVAGTWYHIALENHYQYWSLRKNGVVEASITSSGSFDNGVTKNINIGWSGYSTTLASEYFNGYLDEIRFTRRPVFLGNSVGTTTITPPVYAYPNAIANSALTLSAPFTFIFLSRRTRNGRWISHDTPSPNTLVGHWGTSEASFYMDNNPGQASGYPTTLNAYTQQLNVDYIHTVGKSTSMLDYYLMNGYIRFYNVYGTATNFGTSIIIGGGYNSQEYGAGYMTELLIHNIVVPTSELDAIHKNIGSYYNIKIAPTPTYLSFPNMTSATQVGLTTTWTLTVSGQVYEVSANTQFDDGQNSTKSAFDKNSNTVYLTANLYPATTFTEWVKMKFPVAVYGKLMRVTGVSSTNTQRNLKDAVIQGSNDNTNWTTLFTIPTQDAWATYAVRNFFIPQTSTAYLYFRLYITTKQGQVTTNDYIGIGELDMLYTLTPSIEIPYSISGLTLYLDAHMHNSGTTTWIDRSGNGYHFTILSTAFSNTTNVSFMNFEGSYGVAKRVVSSALANVPSNTNNTFIIFSTILNSTANWRTLIRGATADHSVIIENAANNLGMYDNGSSTFITANFNVSTIPNYTTVFNMYVWKLSQSSPYYQFRYNTNPVWYTITNANATFNNGISVIGGYHEASTAAGTASQYWGKIAVVLYYNRHLTDAEINSIYEFYKPRFPIG